MVVLVVVPVEEAGLACFAVAAAVAEVGLPMEAVRMAFAAVRTDLEAVEQCYAVEELRQRMVRRVEILAQVRSGCLVVPSLSKVAVCKEKDHVRLAALEGLVTSMQWTAVSERMRLLQKMKDGLIANLQVAK